jgi:hypothetical protein
LVASWLVRLVSTSHDWLGGIVVSTKNFVHLLMERWGSEFRVSIVEFQVDGEGHQSSSNGNREESNEQLSNDEGGNHDQNDWNPDGGDQMSVLESVDHDKVAGTSVEGNDGKDTHEDEHVGEGVGEVEFDEVLEVHHESVPGTLAIGITRDGHVSIGIKVDVLDEALKATHAALEEASEAGNDSIVSGVLLGGIDEGVNDGSEDGNEGVDEGSEGDGTGVLEVGNGHTSANTGRALLISVGSEVILGGTDHVDELVLLSNEGKDPEESEATDAEHGNRGISEVNLLVEFAWGTNLRGNGCHGAVFILEMEANFVH